MARPFKTRKIGNPPVMKGFKPYGTPRCQTGITVITFEEYESFRLVNYEQLSQEAAAEKMQVSRPTFTRIYNKALRNFAEALVEGMAIEISGGNFSFDREWFRCRKCHKLIDGMENHVQCKNCDIYNENELIRINPNND